MSGRAYMSIGDVLSLLRQEFPDVTISKIRFLESQGLVNPERTPSGYRKFYEPDVERLRYVLRQQREHFLPLKVIKGRLEEQGDEDGNGAVAVDEAHDPSAHTRRAGGTLPGFEGAQGARAPSSPAPAQAPAERSGPSAARNGGVVTAAPRAEAGLETEEPAPDAETSRSSRAPGRAGRVSTRGVPAPPPVLAEGEMTIEELATASGCSAAMVAGLESYGLVGGRVVGGVVYYGEDALAVASLAASFAGFGVEPRHLRLHKHAAEREAGFIEQVVLPLLKQRNPESRQRAHDTVSELSRLGQELRAVLLRKALRDQLGG